MNSKIGSSQIPSALGTTITGALANIPFPFGIDSEGNYGYKKAGADAVIPFSSGYKYIGVVQANNKAGSTAAWYENGQFNYISSGGDWQFAGSYIQICMLSNYSCQIKSRKNFKCKMNQTRVGASEPTFTEGQIMISSFAYNTSPVMILVE